MIKHPAAFNAWGNQTFLDWLSVMNGVANQFTWEQLATIATTKEKATKQKEVMPLW